MPELPRARDRIESRPAPRRPWVPPALTPESVDHTNSDKPLRAAIEETGLFGPPS
jgi:hypothetical protein